MPTEQRMCLYCQHDATHDTRGGYGCSNPGCACASGFGAYERIRQLEQRVERYKTALRRIVDSPNDEALSIAEDALSSEKG